jgi:hypothetical protein
MPAEAGLSRALTGVVFGFMGVIEVVGGEHDRSLTVAISVNDAVDRAGRDQV